MFKIKLFLYVKNKSLFIKSETYQKVHAMVFAFNNPYDTKIITTS